MKYIISCGSPFINRKRGNNVISVMDVLVIFFGGFIFKGINMRDEKRWAKFCQQLVTEFCIRLFATDRHSLVTMIKYQAKLYKPRERFRITFPDRGSNDRIFATIEG